MSPDRYSLTYRAAKTRQVMSWIQAGQCGYILGLRGAGKSNFLQFLQRQDVGQFYLGQDRKNILFVLLNFLSITKRTEWGVYELIFNGLLEQTDLPRVDAQLAREAASFKQEFPRNRDELLAQQAVGRLVALLCRSPNRRLVMFFDEFDAVFHDLPPSLFRGLRAIRDAHKEQVSYIPLVARDLPDLRSDLGGEVEHFYRLVSRNSCGLGPYNEADSRDMITHLASRRQIELKEAEVRRLIELSGGHAGLLKAILSMLWNGNNPDGLPGLAPTLAKESTIERECRKIWDSLSENEKAALCTFSNGDPLDERALNRLVERGLLRQNKSDTRVIFSPLLASFIKEQAPPPRKGTYISRSPRVVQLDGQSIENLTELEFELLCYLFEQRGRVCTKYDLIENVYRQQYNFRKDGLSDAMLQALISRLREKIEPDREHPKYILTVRGEGYRFGELSADR